MDLKTKLLERAIVYPRNTTRFFIPDGVLDELLDEASVASELPGLQYTQSVAEKPTLGSESIYQRIHGTKDVKQSFRRIFAILVLIEKADAILDFIENSIDDSRLPFFDKPARTGLLYFTHGNTETSLSFTWHWNRSVSTSFLRKQWVFLAPTFESTPENICHYRLSEDHVLPITYDEGPNIQNWEEVQGEMIRHISAFGDLPEIIRVRLHPRHYNFQNYLVRGFFSSLRRQQSDDRQLHCFDGKVVLKKISACDKRQFEQERCALATVTRWRNQHIIPLLASFEVPHQGYYLVFPCAAGDLNNLWKTFPEVVQQRATLAWMLKECHGLTEALAYIHHGITTHSADKSDLRMTSPSPYRHGDLTPSNIVWFPDGDKIWDSRLSIVDLGESVIRDESEFREQVDTHRNTNFNWSYQAPESDNRSTLDSTSAIDIWMLGCVFAEFITWYLLGTAAVQNNFAQARLEKDEKGGIQVTLDAFYTHVDGRFIVKPGVVRWLDTLLLNPGCTDCVRDFIALVRDGMLIAMPDQRVQAETLGTELKLLYRRCIDGDGDWSNSP